MKLSPEAQKAVERRDTEIQELEDLYRKWRTLANKPMSMKDLDDRINKLFSVDDGRSALSFESIAKVRGIIEKKMEKL